MLKAIGCSNEICVNQIIGVSIIAGMYAWLRGCLDKKVDGTNCPEISRNAHITMCKFNTSCA